MQIMSTIKADVEEIKPRTVDANTTTNNPTE